jgi:signal transduction histidine kinase
MRSTFFWIAVLCMMAALLAALAVLQYRSTTEISEATEARIGGNVESLMMDWQMDFYRRFSAICVALQVGPDSGAFDDWAAFRDRYAQWNQTAPDPQLVQGLYIWETSQKSMPRLIRLDTETGLPREEPLADRFKPLLDRLRSRSGDIYSGLRAWQTNDEGFAGDVASHRYLSLRSDPLTGWQFEPNIPAIVHPVVHHRLPLGADEPASPQAIDWIIVVLDFNTIRTQIFPSLTKRHFGSASSADYTVAVEALGNPNRVLYDSSPQAGGSRIDQSDAVMNIFGPPPGSIEDHFWEAVRNANEVKVRNWRHFSSPIWFPVIRYSAQEEPWMLVLVHRKGHLEDLIARVRSVNLLISGVILILLGAGITLVVIAGHRAQNYARLQMDFVASVSHELRTPLTAIYSAGENLADGTVEKKAQLQHYGTIITGQARQLIDLVDRILTFSATRRGDAPYEMRPLEVAQVVNLALKNMNQIMTAAGFSVKVEMAADLPLVTGDLTAIASCIQNLLANAVKYSGKSRWIRVAAHLADASDAGGVQIEVEDKGIGIAASELTDIFKPFYRSSEVKTAQIRGTGLGLAVAKEIAEAMGGRLSVKSSVGAGTTFTLWLPHMGSNLETSTKGRGNQSNE